MRLWFYLKDGQQKGTGPIAEDKLIKMFSARSLSIDTLVWTSGMAEWKIAREVDGLIPTNLKDQQPSPNEARKIIPVKARTIAVMKKQLEASYASMLQMMMGCTSSQAKEMFQNMFEAAKTNAIQSGEIELPENWGDIRLEAAKTNNDIKKRFHMFKMDGVRDEDIRWWGNMHQLEREMMIQIDIWARYAYFSNLIQNYGFSKDKAMNELRKTHPMFGDPEDKSQPSGNDKPLPYELKDRINIYLEKLSQRSQNEIEKVKAEIKRHSSYNAFIRSEIKKGTI